MRPNGAIDWTFAKLSVIVGFQKWSLFWTFIAGSLAIKVQNSTSTLREPGSARVKVEIRLPDDNERLRVFFGPHDSHLRLLRAELGVELVPRNGRLVAEGEDDDVNRAVNVLERLLEALDDGPEDFAGQLAGLLSRAAEEDAVRRRENAVFTDRLKIVPKTPGQSEYIHAIRSHPLVFGLGPAGCGKTYLAVACAIEALRRGAVRRVVMARPAVEAGEKLGFLPGDLRDKVDPYLRPIHDALDDMLSRRQIAQYSETGVLETAPLAFMRGRTLTRAFVLLDEAQNATRGQMKMLLTRLGPQSRCVVTGDLTQVDIAGGRDESGLEHAARLLGGIRGVSVRELGGGDIVRHRLVRNIVEAYENDAAQTARAEQGASEKEPDA